MPGSNLKLGSKAAYCARVTSKRPTGTSWPTTLRSYSIASLPRLPCPVGEGTEAGAPEGTSVEVADLFYNLPARRKFLKSEATEFAHCAEAVRKIALSRPDVAITLTHNDRVTLHLPMTPFDGERWELYDLEQDPTELHDLAAREPERLAELVALDKARLSGLDHMAGGTGPLDGSQLSDSSPYVISLDTTVRLPRPPAADG